MKLFTALALGFTVATVTLPLQPADAKLFGSKQPKEDFAATMPIAAPAATPASAGSIFNVNDGYAALYEGTRARKVGDPLTIVLVERTAASKSSASKLDSNGSFGLNLPTVGPFNPAGIGIPQGSFDAGGNRGFKGEGTADQSNSLSGEISVTVAAVYPNGTMLVQGQKRVTLNRGDEFIQLKGLIRMADIDANNRVASTRVADARIAYTGKGDVARAARQGWLSRFFGAISPF